MIDKVNIAFYTYGMEKETSLTDEEIETIQRTAFRQGMRFTLQQLEFKAIANQWPEWSIERSKLIVGFSLPIDTTRTYDV